MLPSAIVSLVLLLGSSVFHPTNATVETELLCMSNAIYHEARGESYEGQLAVANVIVNRVKSDRYPSTICEVVRQKHKKTCQFSYFCSTKKEIREPEAYTQSIEVAAFAMEAMADGKNISDIVGDSGGCLGINTMWYHAKGVKPYWSSKLKKICVIDNHVFYKEI